MFFLKMTYVFSNVSFKMVLLKYGCTFKSPRDLLHNMSLSPKSDQETQSRRGEGWALLLKFLDDSMVP